MAKKTDRKKRGLTGNLFYCLLVVLLIGVATYPFISDQLLSQRQQAAIDNYDQQTGKMSAKKYLLHLYHLQDHQTNVTDADPFTQQKKSKSTVNVALSQLNTVAVLAIPKIKLQLPVFDTVSETALDNGAGLLNGASDLAGSGKDKNLVILGHSGLSIAKLFTNLPRLKIGDKFYLKVHGKIRAYQIDKLRTVLPDKMLPYLQATAGKNYATLVTCVPLFINTHRLLVRGHRVPYHEEKIVRNSLSPFAWALIVATIILALVLLLHWWSRRQTKKGHRIRN
ncbi:class C sortase [Lactococcus lactis]|uniref:class C sortase n=1 Tax=Lactococcus lactis TaxID=1358 RepID=UPI0014791B92|nr:class C sortase [Lactococcus lactis]